MSTEPEQLAAAQQDPPPPYRLADGLDAIDETIIAAMGTGATVCAAAKVAGIHRNNALVRSRRPEFREALRVVLSERFRDASTRAICLTEEAVETLAKVMRGRGGKMAQVRYQAAEAMLRAAQVLDDRAEVSHIAADAIAAKKGGR